VLGLFAFFYACIHFLLFFSLDRSFSIAGTLSEMVKRQYLIVGSIALLIMVPLAVTSTNAMIKRLGGKRWRALHRLAYLAAIAGVVHYYMQVKADIRQPLVFAGVLGVLLGYRILVFWRERPPARPRRSRTTRSPSMMHLPMMESPRTSSAKVRGVGLMPSDPMSMDTQPLASCSGRQRTRRE
jgi:DMSO/TMAO reductase YedYZ heme-binding membrane subunit